MRSAFQRAYNVLGARFAGILLSHIFASRPAPPLLLSYLQEAIQQFDGPGPSSEPETLCETLEVVLSLLQLCNTTEEAAVANLDTATLETVCATLLETGALLPSEESDVLSGRICSLLQDADGNALLPSEAARHLGATCAFIRSSALLLLLSSSSNGTGAPSARTLGISLLTDVAPLLLTSATTTSELAPVRGEAEAEVTRAAEELEKALLVLTDLGDQQEAIALRALHSQLRSLGNPDRRAGLQPGAWASSGVNGLPDALPLNSSILDPPSWASKIDLAALEKGPENADLQRHIAPEPEMMCLLYYLVSKCLVLLHSFIFLHSLTPITFCSGGRPSRL